MSFWKVIFAGEEEDEVFSSEAEAEKYALYLSSCTVEGAEILHMSNPGDYDADDYNDDYEIIEVDE